MTDTGITALIEKLRVRRAEPWTMSLMRAAADALEALQAERDGIKLDLNDCNNERVSWKARAEKAEVALALKETL